METSESSSSSSKTTADTLPKLPYEVELLNATVDKLYILNPYRPLNVIDDKGYEYTTDIENVISNKESKILLKGNDFYDSHRKANIESLFLEPHKLTHKGVSNGHYMFTFDLTKDDFKRDKIQEQQSNTIFFNRTYLQLNSQYNYRKDRKTIFPIENLLLIDVEKYEEAQLYAPPSENGSNAGGLYYQLGKREFETVAANSGIIPPMPNLKKINNNTSTNENKKLSWSNMRKKLRNKKFKYVTKDIINIYEENPNAFKNELQIPSASNTTTTTSSSSSSSSSSVGGKRKQRVTRKSRNSLRKNKRKHTRKHRLTHLYKFF